MITNRLTIVLFITYLIALFWILIAKLGVQFSYMGDRRVNLIPFSESLIFTGENIMNAVIFVPLGIYAGIIFKKWTLGKNLLFFFLLSLLVEGLQYILRIGAFDVTDMFTNTMGGIMGLMIFKAVKKTLKNSEKTHKLINRLAATGTVLMILFLILLKMNMLPVRYQ